MAMSVFLIVSIMVGVSVLLYDLAYKRGYQKGSDDTYNNMKKVRVRK